MPLRDTVGPAAVHACAGAEFVPALPCAYGASQPRVSRRAITARAAATVTLIAFAVAAAACGDKAGGASEGKEQAVGAADATLAGCSSIDTTPVSLAVRDFIAKAVPAPQRFLSAFGSDSAVPEDGFRVLQDKGPTYFYGSDSVAQRKIREKLAMAGPYASLLVIYRGQSATEGGRAVDVRLAGQYVGEKDDGKKLVTKRYAVRCDSTGWKIASSIEEPAP